jgi:hypothetical protein
MWAQVVIGLLWIVGKSDYHVSIAAETAQTIAIPAIPNRCATGRSDRLVTAAPDFRKTSHRGITHGKQ